MPRHFTLYGCERENMILNNKKEHEYENVRNEQSSFILCPQKTNS